MKKIMAAAGISIGILNEMLFLDIVILAMMALFLLSAICFCFQVMALFSLKTRLTEEELKVYRVVYFYSEEEISPYFFETTVRKMDEIISTSLWMRYAGI